MALCPSVRDHSVGDHSDSNPRGTTIPAGHPPLVTGKVHRVGSCSGWMCGDVRPITAGVAAESVRVRRLTDQERQNARHPDVLAAQRRERARTGAPSAPRRPSCSTGPLTGGGTRSTSPAPRASSTALSTIPRSPPSQAPRRPHAATRPKGSRMDSWKSTGANPINRTGGPALSPAPAHVHPPNRYASVNPANLGGQSTRRQGFGFGVPCG